MKKVVAIAAVALLALALLAGCAGKKPETQPTTPPPPSPPVKTTPSPLSDQTLSTMEKELSDIDALMAELEKEDALDISEVLELK